MTAQQAVLAFFLVCLTPAAALLITRQLFKAIG